MGNAKLSKRAAAFLALVLVVSLAGFGTALSKDAHEKGSAVLKDLQKDSHEKKTAEPKESHAKSPAKAKEPHAAATSHDAGGIDADAALKRLVDGNKRYVAGKPKNPGRSAERRTAVAGGQHPFAVILSCSDSRVPPEVIFDQGVGDLFVVRTAGHVAENASVGSIEYAVEHLGTKLILVLGHSRCGAVTAAAQGGEAPGHIRDVVAAINPAVEKAKGKHGDLVENAIKANVKMVAKNLADSKPILAELIEDGMVRVVGGYYDLDSGAVAITYNPR